MDSKDLPTESNFYREETNMENWLSGQTGAKEDFQAPQEDSQVSDNAQGDNTQDLTSDTIRSLVGYKWLITAIKRSIHIGIPSSQAKSHRDKLLQALESIEAAPHLTRISPRRSPALYTTDYEIPWDLILFLREQEYECGVCPETVSRVITITGGAEFAQALSCKDYMEQMWPLTGADLVKLLEDMIRAPDQTNTGKCCSDFARHRVDCGGIEYLHPRKWTVY